MTSKYCTNPNCKHADDNGNKTLQPLDNFYSSSKGKNGKRAICKDCVKEYNKSHKGKEALKKWKQSPKGKAIKKKDDRKYWESENGRLVRIAIMKRYEQSSKGKTARKTAIKNWKQSPKGRIRKRETDRRRKLSRAHIPGFHTREEWVALCQFFDYKCVKCGNQFPLEKLTRDHIIPISMPGSTDFIKNIQPLCHSCNSSKSNRYVADYRDKPIYWQQLSLF